VTATLAYIILQGFIFRLYDLVSFKPSLNKTSAKKPIYDSI